MSNELSSVLLKVSHLVARYMIPFYLNVLLITVKPRREESKKLRTNRPFFKILYPLDKNQCQAVSGKCSKLKDIQISTEADFNSSY